MDRNPVILVLGEGLQQLPWEGIPSLKDQSVSRMPSLPLLLAHSQQLHAERDGSSCKKTTKAIEKTIEDEEWNMLRNGVRVSRTQYIINPGGDLPATEAALRPVFEERDSTLGWKSATRKGRTPTSSEYRYRGISWTILLLGDFFI
jgi:separase